MVFQINELTLVLFDETDGERKHDHPYSHA